MKTIASWWNVEQSKWKIKKIYIEQVHWLLSVMYGQNTFCKNSSKSISRAKQSTSQTRIDRQIHLKDETSPVNVRPYRNDPLHFFSFNLSEKQRVKPIYKRELMIILLVVQHSGGLICWNKVLLCSLINKPINSCLNKGSSNHHINVGCESYLDMILTSNTNRVWKIKLLMDALSKLPSTGQLITLIIPNIVDV